jgi:hypothetical protein
MVHPNGTCLHGWNNSTVCGMEYNWKISGSHANWHMTLAVDPPHDGEKPDLRCWTEEDLEGLASHFRDSVQLWEMYEEYEPLSAKRTR